MKKTIKAYLRQSVFASAVIIALAAIIGLGMAGCESPTDSGSPDGGGQNATPVRGDFDINGLWAEADGSPKEVSITPKNGKSPGKITVWYAGASGTSYTRSTDAPSAIGRYAVTFDVAAAEGFNPAAGLSAGTLVIEKNQTVGTLTGGPLVHEYVIKAANTRYVEDTALIHLINDAMLYYTQAYNVTLTGTAPLSPTANAEEGNLTRADMSDIYIYDNTLCVIEMTGSQFKEWMEWAHWDYHQTKMKPGELTVPYGGGGTGYNFDQFKGLTYQVDLTKDQGQRIVNMKNPDGTNFDMNKTYRVAVNNYRVDNFLQTISPAVTVIARDVDASLTVNGETITNGDGMKGVLADYIERVKGGTITNEFTPSWEFIIPAADEAWYAAYRAKAVELLNNGTLTFSATRPVTVTDVKPYMPEDSIDPPAEYFPAPQEPKKGPLTVDFEDAAWNAGNYSERTVNSGGFEWTVSGVGIMDGNDRYTGTKSIRLRGNSGDKCRVELMDYLTTGIETVSFDYASYSSHSNGTIALYYQIKGSANWVKAGEVTAPAWDEAMLNTSYNLNIASAARVKIVREGGLASYTSVNVDNIVITCAE